MKSVMGKCELDRNEARNSCFDFFFGIETKLERAA